MLKRLFLLLIFSLSCTNAFAGNDVILMIKDLMNDPGIQEDMNPYGIKLIWGKTPADLGISEDIKSDTYSRSANGFMRSAQKTCASAFQEFLKSMLNDAVRYGANAIIDLRSYNEERGRNDPASDYVSDKYWRCQSGKTANIRARFVRLAEEPIIVPERFTVSLQNADASGIDASCDWNAAMTQRILAQNPGFTFLPGQASSTRSLSAEITGLHIDSTPTAKGKQWIRATGALLEKGVVQQGFKASRELPASRASACETIRVLSDKLGRDIARWLRNPVTDASLGDD